MPDSKIVILGAGYGGLYTALKLNNLLDKHMDCTVTLIDRCPHHQLKTELHMIVSGRRSFRGAAIPIKKILEDKRVKFLNAEVKGIRFDEKTVITTAGKIQYDILVVALGSEVEFFGIPGLKEYAFTLNDVGDALLLREHIKDMLMQGAGEEDESTRRSMLTFTIGGGGFTGVELAAELAGYLKELAEEFRISRDEIRLVIVEARGSILPGFDAELAEKAARTLRSADVDLLLKRYILSFDGEILRFNDGGEIRTRTLIWTGGVRANSLLSTLGLKCGSRGRVIVNPFLESVDYGDVYVIGDCSLIIDPSSGRPLAPTAQLALQQAETAAYNIYAGLVGDKKRRFKPKILGQIVSLGDHRAVGCLLNLKLYGFSASLLKSLSLLRYIYHIGGVKMLLYILHRTLGSRGNPK